LQCQLPISRVPWPPIVTALNHSRTSCTAKLRYRTTIERAVADDILMLVSGTNENLYRQDEGLQSQNRGVNDTNRVAGVQIQSLERSKIFVGKEFMIVGVSVSNAAATRRHVIHTTLIKRLKKNRQRARPRQLLHINELLRRPDLTRCNVVLHTGNHHWYDGQRFGNAGNLGDHAGLDDLCLDLPKARD